MRLGPISDNPSMIMYQCFYAGKENQWWISYKNDIRRVLLCPTCSKIMINSIKDVYQQEVKTQRFTEIEHIVKSIQKSECGQILSETFGDIILYR